MATAYVGLALLASTLALGPLNVLLHQPNPVSTYLRRDLGIWGGLVATAHVAVGLQRHMNGQWWLYFTFPGMGGHLLGLRYDIFGIANWLGVLGTLVILLLLAISNNRALVGLGVPRWKAMQRWNYLVFPAVVLHGFAYQKAEDRAWTWVVVMVVTLLVTLALQLLGMREIRARKRPPSASPAPPRPSR